MIEILPLNENEYKGKEFTLHYTTHSYLDIVPSDHGFSLSAKAFDEAVEMSFKDQFFNDWLEHPAAYGAFENGKLLGYVEGSLET